MATVRSPNQRLASQIRPLSIETGVNRYAEGSALIRCGNTHVLCTASVEETVPGWLAGKGRGWVTAEYSMLPRSTHTRSKRDREKVSGRTQEIQRLIGRALRTMVDLKALGEKSIIVDCDVIQADGGTRTASITGGCVALAMALTQLEKSWVDTVAGISVGMKAGEVLVDLDYDEDSTCDVDMNFVMTGQGLFVEVQGTAERQPFAMADMQRMTDLSVNAFKEINRFQLDAIKKFS
jgi:ribonuclease PH